MTKKRLTKTLKKHEKCKVCGLKVKIAIFKGTGLCSDLCRKVDKGDMTKEEMQAQKSAARKYAKKFTQ